MTSPTQCRERKGNLYNKRVYINSSSLFNSLSFRDLSIFNKVLLNSVQYNCVRETRSYLKLPFCHFHLKMMEVGTASSRANDIIKMEVNNRSSRSIEKRSIEVSTPRNEAKKNPENNESSTPVFINHAAIAWNEGRRQWIGDQSQKSSKMPKDPVISWSATYEDLLSTSNRFSEPIPLPEMVDFLVDIWHTEGLFD
ncbi:hypothetical protein L1887_09407 [Cichorium endivia]|nr:hypothetical protein L1887_09407 [Cichorium endivia]